jgi:hypothetical protein
MVVGGDGGGGDDCLGIMIFVGSIRFGSLGGDALFGGLGSGTFSGALGGAALSGGLGMITSTDRFVTEGFGTNPWLIAVPNASACKSKAPPIIFANSSTLVCEPAGIGIWSVRSWPL